MDFYTMYFCYILFSKLLRDLPLPSAQINILSLSLQKIKQNPQNPQTKPSNESIKQIIAST